MSIELIIPLALSALLQAPPVSPQGPDQTGVITARGHTFASWADYVSSPYFQGWGLRCGTVPRETPANILDQPLAPPNDCAYGSTNPQSEYDPTFTLDIPVVVHVIERTNGTGHITEARVRSQIDILNEDFQAIAGSNGANGNNGMIQFHLATVDPDGNATTGITYSVNNTWYNDSGSYWNTLAWDTNNYLNIYTNNAGGYLGYVPDLPQGGIVGSNSDRVVVLHSSFGDNGPIGPPYNQGRTTTHEVGHYLGLWHTFDGGCGSASNCYNTGDRICDTNAESGPEYGCSAGSSCGSTDPIHNYMDYSEDLCMWEFSPEQINRMRCTLEHYRPDLAETGGGGAGPANDNCADCEPIIGPGTVAFDNTNANTDGGADCSDGGSNNIDADVWYCYLSFSSGTATVSTCGQTGIDTKIAVYDYCGGNLIACNDDTCGTDAEVSFPVSALTSYSIRIGSYPGSAEGSGTLTVSEGSGCSSSISNYCTSSANSTGGAATINAGGTASVSANDTLLSSYPVPPNQFGLFFYGPNQVNAPLGNGRLCVGGGVYRLGVVSSDSFGIAMHSLDITSPPQASGQITAGSTWNFQYWFRDPGTGASNDLSDAVQISFCG
ncbi:MAG: zinc metalloprotease [Planctomycetota bacterium]|jgi:hypothetical protein|nr:zinc metalloprotease [Planctomycetota bacterium]MDP6955088.1 zinc metalloprotease [Planctomycetota bacterium]